MDEIKSVLLEILEETRPDVDFEGEEALIDDKSLSSARSMTSSISR